MVYIYFFKSASTTTITVTYDMLVLERYEVGVQILFGHDLPQGCHATCCIDSVTGHLL